MTQPNADKLKLLPCPFCGASDAMPLRAHRDSQERLFPIVRCMSCFVDVPGKNDDYRPDARSAIEHWNARPAPRVGDDVVEAMAKVIENAGYYSESYSKELMNGALSAAEAMDYTLCKQDRVLPELPPEEWILQSLSQWQDPLERWECFLQHTDGHVVKGEGPTPRAACLAAIAKVQK